MATSFSFSFSLVDLASNLVMLIFSRLSILATVFFIMKIKTPYTINFIIFGLECVMACRNSFTNIRIKFNYMLNKPKTLTCQAHSTFLPTIHCRSLSISKKMIFPLLEKNHYHFLFIFVITI